MSSYPLTFYSVLCLAAPMTLSGCEGGPDGATPAPYRPTPTYPVRVAKPDGPPRVATDRVDALGRAVEVACPTCHSLNGFGSPTRVTGEATSAFHQALVTRHGQVSCRSCHNAPGYAELHLADGRPLPYTEVQLLCRQCHGPQARDFDHGSHGGMRGFWDLSKGPRERHACVTCHDPHAPAYEGMMPARGPIPTSGAIRDGEH